MDPKDLQEVLAVAAEERRVCRRDEVKPLLDALKLAWDWIGYKASDRPAKVDKQIIDAIAAGEEQVGA
jgi:hypothetical protein